MRIALVTNFCPFYRVKLYKLLARQKDINYIFTSAANESNWETLNPTGIESVKLTQLQPKPRNPISVILGLLKALSSAEIVLQGLTGFVIVPISFIYAKLAGKPFILWTGLWHHPSSLKHKLTFPLVKYIYRHADALIVYGTHVRDYLLKLGVAPSKIFIAWNTADNEQYSRAFPADERQALRAELKLSERPLLMFVGRLDLSKGVDIILKALAKFDSPPELIIIGRGAEIGSLKSFCKDNHLDKVHFLGYVANKELYKYYNIADAMIVPSITTKLFKEPWGLIVNEAMNQGTPVIASDAVGAAMGGLILDGANGLVVPENNPQALFEALSNLTPNKIEALSYGAKKTIKAWTYERMAQGFLDAINFVAPKKR